jgi:hypothetical protein
MWYIIMTAMKPQKSNAEFWGLFSLEPCYTSTIYRYRLATTATFQYQPKKTAKITGKNFTVYAEL